MTDLEILLIISNVLSGIFLGVVLYITKSIREEYEAKRQFYENLIRSEYERNRKEKSPLDEAWSKF